MLFSLEKTVIQFDDYLKVIEQKLPELQKNINDLLIAKNNVFKANALHDVNFYGSLNGIGQKKYPDRSRSRDP